MLLTWQKEAGTGQHANSSRGVAQGRGAACESLSLAHLVPPHEQRQREPEAESGDDGRPAAPLDLRLMRVVKLQILPEDLARLRRLHRLHAIPAVGVLPAGRVALTRAARQQLLHCCGALLCSLAVHSLQEGVAVDLEVEYDIRVAGSIVRLIPQPVDLLDEGL